jgi:hypothetical protein
MTGDSQRSPSLERWFPELADWGYSVTSDIDYEYNCIAWANVASEEPRGTKAGAGTALLTTKAPAPPP